MEKQTLDQSQNPQLTPLTFEDLQEIQAELKQSKNLNN